MMTTEEAPVNHPITARGGPLETAGAPGQASPDPDGRAGTGASSEDEVARDLTYAVMRHYGYTDADLAYAEQVHPGQVCDEDRCYGEDGKSTHWPVFHNLHETAALMVEVVSPMVADRLAAHERVMRYAHLMANSVSTIRAEMARDILDIADNAQA